MVASVVRAGAQIMVAGCAIFEQDDREKASGTS
jgi:pentose-5-phosphate-3-epimerase